jgi:WD40 repeat protein
VAANEQCRIESHSRSQIHQSIKALWPDIPDPLIEIIKRYIARSQKWKQGHLLAINDGHRRTVQSIMVLSTNELAVSYMHDAHEAMIVPSPVSYSKVWNLTTGNAADFPLPAFVGGVALPRERVAVIVDSSTVVPIYDVDKKTIEERFRYGRHKKHAVASIVLSAPARLIVGLNNGDVKFGDFAKPQEPLIAIAAHEADAPQHPELVPHNSAQAVWALTQNRAIVGKKCGQLRIVDLEAQKWSEELVAQSAPRTVVRKIVGWPNDRIAVLRGHVHDEGIVQIWDVAGNGVLMRSLPKRKGSALKDIVALPDQTVAIAHGAHIELVETDRAQLDEQSSKDNLLKNVAKVTCLAAPHGDQIAAGLRTGQVQLWNRVSCAACAQTK